MQNIFTYIYIYTRRRGRAHRGAGGDEKDKYSDNGGDNLKEKEEAEEEEGPYASSRACGKCTGGSWRNNVGGPKSHKNYWGWSCFGIDNTILLDFNLRMAQI